MTAALLGLVLLIAAALGGTRSGAPPAATQGGRVAPFDSMAVTLAVWGEARPIDAIHRVVVTDPFAFAVPRRWRTTTIASRADTIQLALPARLLAGRERMEMEITALSGTPRLRLTFDLIRAGADSVERCVGDGRFFALARLDEGGIVHGVDHARPFTCARAARVSG